MGKAKNGIAFDRQWVRNNKPQAYYGDLGRGKNGKQVYADFEDIRRSSISVYNPRRVIQVGEFPVILSCERSNSIYGGDTYHVDIYRPKGDQLIATGSTDNKESLDYCLKQTFKDIGVQVSNSKNVSNIPYRKKSDGRW